MKELQVSSQQEGSRKQEISKKEVENRNSAGRR
jgi:hypothetical protein